MLVITRTEGNSIIINDDIVVNILSINGNQVKIGVSAPKNVSILRNEVHERKKTKQK